MLALIQRVTSASVTIDEKVTADIKQGLLILCGFKAEDSRFSDLDPKSPAIATHAKRGSDF